MQSLFQLAFIFTPSFPDTSSCYSAQKDLHFTVGAIENQFCTGLYLLQSTPLEAKNDLEISKKNDYYCIVHSCPNCVAECDVAGGWEV